MAINFPLSPSIGQLYTFAGSTWEWSGEYWEVYSGISSSVVYSITTSTGLSADTITGNVTLLNTLPNYAGGVLTNYSGWTNNGNGTINLPSVQVALYDNTNFLEPLRVYTIASGVTGSGGISPLTDNDTNYIYIEYNNGSPRWVVSTDNSAINGSTVVRFQNVYRIGNFIHNLEWGNEGAGLPNKIVNRIDAVDRFARESGLSLGLSGSTGVVTLSAGVAWNGTLRQSLASVNSQDDIFFQNFHSGGTWVISTTADTLNNIYYDDGTDRVVASAGTYLVNWYYRGQEINDHLYEVWGNSAYTSVANAQLSLQPELPELITSHAFLLGRIILQKNALTGFVETAFVTPFQSTTVQNHNDLTGLQGGSAGEYYHLNANQYNNIALTNVNNNFSTSQTINGNLNVSGDTIIQSGLTANTINTTQLGSSGDCVDDIYVSNIHSCSPLNINPLDEGNVYFGSTSGVTINLSGTPKVSINTNSLDAKLNILNSFTTIGSELLANPSISANTTGWFLSNCTTWNPGLFTYFYSGCNDCEIVWTDVNLTSGKYYLVSFEITECDNPVYIDFDFNNPPGTFDGNRQFGTGKHKFLFKSNYTGLDTIYFFSFECDGTIKIGNFSFIEVQSPDYIIDGQYFEGSNLIRLGGYGENISLGEESATSTSGNTNVISIGSNAGSGVKDKKFNTFIGNSAGLNSDINTSTVIGTLAGGFSKQKESIIIGQFAGYFSSGNTGGGGGKNIFIGDRSGQYSNTNNSSLTLIGRDSGFGMYNSFANVGIGWGVGYYASGVSTNMIGTYAGRFSQTSYSTLIGYQAGQNFTGGNNNIIIGTNVTLPNNVSNSINLGNVLYGINTYYDNSGGGPSSIPTIQGKIGIGIVTPLNRLHVEDTSNPVRFVGLQSGNTDTRILTSDSNGVIKYRNLSDFNTGSTSVVGDYLALSGGTVTGGTIFQSGLTATTISATTYLNLPVSNFTGGTVSGPTTFTNGLSANTISATTISGGTFYGDGSNLTGIANIYNSNGVLTGNRTLSGASNDLTFADLNVFKTTSGGTDIGLKLDFANQLYELGDTNNNIGVKIDINNGEYFYGNYGGSNSFMYQIGTDTIIGDVFETYSGSQTYFGLNTIKTRYQANDIGLKLDFGNTFFEIGDFNSNTFRIQTNNNTIQGTVNAVNAFLLDGLQGIYKLGDYDFILNNTSYIIDDTNQIIKTSNQGNDIGLKLDFANNKYVLGDDPTGLGFVADLANQTYYFGDYGQNGNTIEYNSSTGILNTNFGFINQGLHFEMSNGLYQFGQITGSNQTYLTIDDTSQVIKTTSGSSDIGLNLDYINASYVLGDYNGISGFYDYFAAYTSTGIEINSNRNIFLGDVSPPGNSCDFNIDISNTIIKSRYNTNDIGLKLDFANNTYLFGGDMSLVMFDNVIANSGTISTYFNIYGDSNGFIIDSQNVTNAEINYVRLGDIINQTNGIVLELNNTNELIYTKKGLNDIGLKLDFANSTYSLGDFDNTSGGTKVILDDSAKSISTFVSTAATPALKIFSTGNISINNSADAGYKLYINSISDPVRFDGLQVLNTDTQVVTTDANGVLHKRVYDVVTGFTYASSSNTLTIRTSQPNTYSATINQMSGLTINGNLNVTGNYFVSGDTIVSGNTVFTGTTTYNSVPNAIGDFLTLPTSNVMSRRTSHQVRDDIGYYGLTFAITNGYY